MRRVVFAACLVGCTTPDFQFASPGDASMLPTDAGVDADAAPPPPAPPIAPIVLADGDFGDACNGLNAASPSRVFTHVWRPASGPRHCWLYFASDPHRRTWAEAKAACGVVTTKTPARTSHLATFTSMDEATALQTDFFRAGQIPWIGLELRVSDAPTSKASFAWVTGEPTTYDGWAAGSPSGAACVTWAGAGQWIDLSCNTQKGFLCELEE